MATNRVSATGRLPRPPYPSEPVRPAPARAGVRVSAVAGGLSWASSRFSFVEDEVAGLRPFVRPGAVCLDIGAEYGLYTWALSALSGPEGSVHSIEPLPGPAAWLRTAASAFGCDNVTVHRVALAARAQPGTMSLPRRRLLPVHGRAYLTEGANGPGPNTEFARSRSVATAVRTVDGLCHHLGLDRVDFIKADVEGAEAAVLAGARRTLLRHRPSLLLEIEDRHLAKYDARPAGLVAGLRGLGYSMYRWREGGWHPEAAVTDDFRNYLFTTRPPTHD
ncbi:FkbM family methyltransferase [Streptomyces avidinii]|uniref:FkbM family methyltransferase n=1 Tax=Streptomyces avidinii TaxID=1895 RepID=A0ABS4LHB4_STRAV|nr:FkbM family methyltransferase [Streptomyces avidinii]MBP2041496.1 FkbM family methyltransferase [Streptomyces avidinii]GGZ34583.1 putative methyltransferase [Streptomyces avidinii]